MFNLIETPSCKVLLIEPWNAPRGRYFISYRALNDFRSVLGLPVIDEFATFSSPIFFCPTPILGKIYNAGISLGHKRDPEMGIDLGWPPLVIGYQAAAPELKESWEQELLKEIMKAEEQGSGGAGEITTIDEYEIRRMQIGECEIFATNAPLLPKQLQRIAQLSNAPFCIAFSTGNRLTAQKNAQPLVVKAAAEGALIKIIDALRSKS
ncbi:hypothetical protein L0152_19465 [bacterium]|nr:hypothetical protein [bacterium]